MFQLTASQMQEYGSGIANKSGESRDATDGHCQDGFHIQHHYPVIQKGYGNISRKPMKS